MLKKNIILQYIMQRVNTSKKTASKKTASKKTTTSKTSRKLLSIPGDKEYNPDVYYKWRGYYSYYTYFYADYINYKYDNTEAYKGRTLEFDGKNILIHDTFSKKQILKSQKHLNDFTRFMTNTNKRFLIIPISINFKINSANILIYDTVKNELELFDPQGHASRTALKKKGVSGIYGVYIEKIKELMDTVLQKWYRFYEVASFLPPNEEIQTKEIQICSKEKFKISSSIGFCAVWSLWYAESRIKNPSIDREVLVEELKKNLEQNIKSSKKTQTVTDPKICRVIRGYTLFLKELDKNKTFREKYILLIKLHSLPNIGKMIGTSIRVIFWGAYIFHQFYIRFSNDLKIFQLNNYRIMAYLFKLRPKN